MIKINFYPESDKIEYIEAAAEYEEIWNRERDRITAGYEQKAGLEFVEKTINALIYEGTSFSYPLRFRASYPVDVKKATLIHELGHRLLRGNCIGVHSHRESDSLSLHKELNLILYDLWHDLYGDQFANEQVLVESRRTPVYQEAWDWALAKSPEERRQAFAEILSGHMQGFDPARKME